MLAKLGREDALVLIGVEQAAGAMRIERRQLANHPYPDPGQRVLTIVTLACGETSSACPNEMPLRARSTLTRRPSTTQPVARADGRATTIDNPGPFLQRGSTWTPSKLRASSCSAEPNRVRP